MNKHHPAAGFTLIELSIVLVIVALLSGGLMLGLSAQRSAGEYGEAERQLDNIREALLGFAITHGRLPCPADPALDHSSALVGLENCSREHGVVPWASLGIAETDPWGQRFTYFASSKFTAPLVAGAQASFTLATGVAPDNADTANIKESSASGGNIAADIPAVVVCHGSRGSGAYQPSGAQLPGAVGEELENADADQTFIAHTPTDGFDDLLTWVVPSILKSRLVAAGRLP